MKYLVITGVSSGIGAGCVSYFINQGYHVFGSVRTERDAQRCKETYGTQFTPLVFDVRDIQAINQATEMVKSTIGDQNIAGLINNAGIAVSGPIQYVEPQLVQDQFDINVIGVINVTRAFLPLLGGRMDNQSEPGRIVHIGSVAGTFTMPMQIPYATSKHAIEAITDGMRREFDIYGIKVITLRPGPVESMIWSKEMSKTANYDGTIYESIWDHKASIIEERIKKAMPVDHVTRIVDTALHTTSPKRFYVVVRNKFRYYLMRLIPRSWADYLIRRQMNAMMNTKTKKHLS